MAQPPYTAGVPSVEPLATPPSDYQHIEANPSQFGGAIAQGVSQLGEGAITATKFYAQIAAQQATNNWTEETNKILFGDPNVKDDVGYYGLHGQAAMEQRHDVLQRIRDARENALQSLSLPISQSTFNNETRRLEALHQSQIGQHYDKESQAWGIGVNKATAANDLVDYQKAVLSGDQAGMATASLAYTNHMMQGAQLKDGGTNPELERRVREEAQSTLAVGAIQAVLPTDPARASQMLEANKNVIPGHIYGPLLQHLKTRTDQIGGTDAAIREFQGARGASLADIHPNLASISAPGGAKFTVAAEAAPKFQGLINDLEAAGYKIDPSISGGYNPRNIAGTNTPSEHAYGRAIDINSSRNQQGAGLPSDIPPDLARSLAAKYGLRWGGDFSGGRRDPMHFEVLPSTGSQPTLNNAAGPIPAEARQKAIDNIINNPTMRANPPMLAQSLAVIDHLFAENDRVVHAQTEAGFNDWMTKIITNPSSINPTDIANDPRLDGEHKRILEGTRAAKIAGRGDGPGERFNELFGRTLLPDDSPDRIASVGQLYPYVNHGLNPSGYKQLEQHLSGRNTVDGETLKMAQQSVTKTAESLINPKIGGKSPSLTGVADYDRFLGAAYVKAAALMKEGKMSPLEIWAEDGPIAKMAESYASPIALQMRESMRGASGRTTPPASAAPPPPTIAPASPQLTVGASYIPGPNRTFIAVTKGAPNARQYKGGPVFDVGSWTVPGAEPPQAPH